MAERQSGIQVDEEAGFEQAISLTPATATAFVGRTLRGPLNRAVALDSFAEFKRIFGGLWQPSTLSYAIEQYFENGGRHVIVVRVANDARPCTLTLAAGTEALVLEALAPGTREFLRAAVDYDGIGDNDEDSFNLVLQRVRTPGSEHIEEQEIFRRLSVREDSSRYVGQALADSRLVRIRGEVPNCRLDRTVHRDPRGLAGYLPSNSDGQDGGPITDYDIIGSATQGTGLFALSAVESFGFLVIPPPTRDVDLGPSVLLVANHYCRERGAMLAVDPPLDWDTADKAIAGMAQWPLASDSAFMYFPRLMAYDKLRGRFEAFAPAAAVAGALSRATESWPLSADEVALRPGLKPMCAVDDRQSERLAALGVNVTQTVRRPGARQVAACTLASSASVATDWRALGARRLALMITGSIERGTRWMLFEPNGPEVWQRAVGQLRTFFVGLDERGAFGSRAAGSGWYVVCDERVNPANERERGIVSLLFGIAAARPGEFHSFLVSHRAGGSRVRVVTLNRLQPTADGALDPELELELPLADVG